MWSVEHASHFRGHFYVDGWAFHPRRRIKWVALDFPGGTRTKVGGYGQPSPDVAAHHGAPATDCRFSFRVAVPDPHEARNASLVFGLGRGSEASVSDLSRNLGRDPFHQLFPRFQELVRAFPAAQIVEIGSRARSGNVNIDWLPSDASYVGFDVRDGPNVDVVGDAHHISRHFPPASVDAIYSVSTVEHLAMPWKAVLEMNAILKPGGLVFAGTHQTWPVHDEPWDFWRFSSYSWSTLFNAATGFELVDVTMGERASVVADFVTEATAWLDYQPAFLGSSVIARKIASTDLTWDVDLGIATEHEYPA